MNCLIIFKLYYFFISLICYCEFIPYFQYVFFYELFQYHQSCNIFLIDLISTHRKIEKTPNRHQLLQVEEELLYLQSLKIQAGWIMMEQLLSFDIHWVGSKLKALFGLWQQEFSFENNEWFTLDEQSNYLKISVPCLKTLRTFLRKCKTLHTDHVLKLVGSYLINFFNAFLADSEKEKWKSANERQTTEYSLAKIVRN